MGHRMRCSGMENQPTEFSGQTESRDAGNDAMLRQPVSTVTLDNGLEVLVRTDRAAPVVSLQVWFRIGSIGEGDWLGAGLSHVLEHMLFKGTDRREGVEVSKTVHAQGGRINAYTSFDHTVYWIDTPVGGWKTCLDVLLDIAFHATLPTDVYEKEQEVIRREIAMGEDDPGRVLSRLLFSTAYAVHPARHPVIGYQQVFDTLTREDVLRHYQRHYGPNNAFVVVSGDVDADEVIAEIKDLAGEEPRRPLPPVDVPAEPEQLGPRVQHREFAGTEITRMFLAWKIGGVTDPDMPALALLAGVLGDGRSARLVRSLREEQGLVYGIRAGTYTPHGVGLFAVSAECGPEKREAAIQAVRKELDRVMAGGVREEELDKVRAMTVSGLVSSLATADGQASDIGSNWFLTRNPHFGADYLDAIQKVRPDDLRKVAGRYLVDRTMTIVSINPEGASSSEAVRSEASKIKTTMHELSNGLRVLLRCDPRLPMVSFHASFRGGLLAENEGAGGLTRLFSRCLVKGTKSRSAAEIAEAVEALGGSVSSSSGNNTFAIELSGLSESTDTLADLFSEILMKPAFAEEEIEREKQLQLAAIAADQDHPLRKAMRKARAERFPGHPYARDIKGTPDEVSSHNRDSLTAFATEYLCAVNGCVAVAGDFDADNMLETLEEGLGTMREGECAFPRLERVPGPEQTVRKELSDQCQQAILVVVYPGLALDDPRRLASEILDDACSDMSSRFFQKIREDLGLAYYVGSTRFMGYAGGAFAFYLGTSPEQAGKVEEVLLNEIALLQKNGLTEEEFVLSGNRYRGSRVLSRQGASSIVSTECLDEVLGLGRDYEDRLLAELDDLKIDEVNALASELFSQSPVIVKLAG